MNKWVITFNNISHGDKLLYSYETIEGKNAMDALKKRFGRQFKRLTGDSSRFANVILMKGYFADNSIHYVGKCQSLCYGVII
jgi:hypothetical protein